MDGQGQRAAADDDTDPVAVDPGTLGALILEVEEDCTTQLCHELHDGLSQLLMALQAHLQVYDLASKAGKIEKAIEEFSKSKECLNQAVRECRRLVTRDGAPESDFADSLRNLAEEAAARWNWNRVDFHDLRDPTAKASQPRAERLALLRFRRMIAAFRRRSGLDACLELRSDAGPPGSLCVEFLVTGESLVAFPLSADSASITESILSKVQGLTQAVGGILKVESTVPAEIHIAIVLPADEPLPKSSAVLQDKKEANHAG